MAAIMGGASDDQVWQAMGAVHDALFAQPGSQGMHGADLRQVPLPGGQGPRGPHHQGPQGRTVRRQGQLRDMQDQFSMDLKREDFAGAQAEEGSILSFEGSDETALGMDGYGISMSAQAMQGQLATGEQGQARTQAAARTAAERRRLKDLSDKMEADKLHKDTTAYRADVAAYTGYRGSTWRISAWTAPISPWRRRNCWASAAPPRRCCRASR